MLESFSFLSDDDMPEVESASESDLTSWSRGFIDIYECEGHIQGLMSLIVVYPVWRHPILSGVMGKFAKVRTEEKPHWDQFLSAETGSPQILCKSQTFRTISLSLTTTSTH
jgi:hypothetical protein